MIRAHVDAVLSLLSTQPGVRAYDGEAPAGAVLPYAVVYADSGAADATSLGHASTWRTFRVWTVCVGSTQLQVRALEERVETALLDVTPTVTGRRVTPIRKGATQPVRRDDDVDPAVFEAADIWGFSSVPV